MLSLFFVPSIPELPHIVVDGDEAHHAIKVLRIAVGDEVMLADGAGAWAQVILRSLDKRSFAAEVLERGTAELPQRELIVVQALMKSDRAKEAIELLTVAGADRIIPWESHRSIAKWQSDLGQKWLGTAMTAAKQSRRIRLPEIEAPITLKQIGARFGTHANLLVLHEEAQRKLSDVAKEISDGPIVLVIGPEGGLTPEEIEALTSFGGDVALLGAEVLRSAHAGFAGLAAISSLIGRW